jgi:hypothetical protein
MKVLTLTQPWATLVAIGAKKIETRSWATSYRGPLAIHAAAGLRPVGGKIGLREQCEIEPFDSVLKEWWWGRYIAGGRKDPRSIVQVLPRGAIVAVCRLVACITTYDAIDQHLPSEWPLTDQERAFGDYSPGRYACLLADVRPLAEPIPAKGALGLWNYDGELPQ